MSPALRLLKDGADTPERILNAALAAFAEKGFDGASTREIATRAGVPQGLLRYHFGDKTKLWRAAVDRAFKDIHDSLDEALAAKDADDQLSIVRRAVRSHIRFVARNPEFVRIMYDEGKRRGERMRWLVDRHAKPMLGAICPAVEALQRDGRLPASIAPIHFVYALVGAIDGIFHQAHECKRASGIDPTDEAEIEAHADTIDFLFFSRTQAPLSAKTTMPAQTAAPAQGAASAQIAASAKTALPAKAPPSASRSDRNRKLGSVKG